MDNLISRQSAIEVADAVWTVTGDKNVAKVWQQIKDLPSVDAVKVIRCEQCEHYNNIEFWCYYHGSMCFKPNDYCPYGKARDNR